MVPNSYGSCDCAPGYEFDSAQACIDIDECAKSLDNCVAPAACHNIDGGFSCDCAADLFLEPNGSHGCRCMSGYEMNGDGLCIDLNECTNGTANCHTPTSICTNTPGSFTCAGCGTGLQDNDENQTCTPTCAAAALTCNAGEYCSDANGTAACGAPRATCLERQTLDGVGVNGPQTLFLNHDPQYPWTAYCMQMDATPIEYLTLPTGPSLNVSTYLAGGWISGTTVVTVFSRVRIDPSTLIAKIDDYTFSTSSGKIDGWDMTRIPYANAGACGGDTGHANVNLTGTRFTIAETFAPVGYNQYGWYSPDPYTTTVDLYGGGECGSMAPVTDNGGWNLHLSLAVCPNHAAGQACAYCLVGYEDPDHDGVCTAI